MKIMMMIWETATSAFVKKKTTMKLSQSYFHPTVHVICILGTANKKLNSRYCFLFLLIHLFNLSDKCGKKKQQNDEKISQPTCIRNFLIRSDTHKLWQYTHINVNK
jgi:hypothetical protein